MLIFTYFYCIFQSSDCGTPDIDGIVAEATKDMARFNFDDLDSETKDLFVIVDNPEKHVSTMESYITFRITTKVCILFKLSVKLTQWYNNNIFYLYGTISQL